MKNFSLIFLTIIFCSSLSIAKKKDIPWPQGCTEVQYPSKADQSNQPAMVYTPKQDGNKRPLLVALHTWSGHHKQRGSIKYAEWCIQNDWYMIHPNFRGPNKTPQAMGSELVVNDIVSAVEYMKKNYAIDNDRIYLMGGSGGGHAALLMAGRTPDIWAGVSAWCGITDIQKWWDETRSDSKNSKYAENIEMAVGGKPSPSSKEADECKKRSPVTYLNRAKKVKLDINHGVMDGRTGSVPFTHSLHAFNLICQEKDQLSNKEIKQFYKDAQKPGNLKSESLVDPLYGDSEPLFRRVSDNVRITIFNGGHENIFVAGLNWLSIQNKNKPVEWNISDPIKVKSWENETNAKKIER